MGEHSAMRSIREVMKSKQTVGLGVIGLKLMQADLKEPLKRLSIDVEIDAEIDITSFYCNGDTVTMTKQQCRFSIAPCMGGCIE